MKRRARYNQCGRKKRYTVRQAHYVAEKLNERQRKRVHAYFCDFCKQHHIGRVREIDLAQEQGEAAA